MQAAQAEFEEDIVNWCGSSDHRIDDLTTLLGPNDGAGNSPGTILQPEPVDRAS